MLEVDENGEQTAENIYGIYNIARVIGNNSYTYLHNGHGDVVALIDSEENTVNRYTYDAFGVILTSTETVDNPFRYTGYWYDSETGLYYLMARYYNPVNGRFLSEDPVMDGYNWYVYCDNNPVIYIDPNGEAFMFLTAAIGAVVGGIGGAIYSYAVHGEVKWQNVVTGAAIGGVVGLTGGAAAAYVVAGKTTASVAAVAIGVQLKIAGSMTTGYATYEAFKKAYGSAGKGKAWHHIVEQTPANISRFGAEMIHNAKNIVKIPHGAGKLHNMISGHYSSIQSFTDGMTVRKWLSTQSFEKQLSYGLETLTKYAKELGISIEFVK